MRTVIVWWDLSDSVQTIESLRTYLLDESVTAFAEVPGLRFKMWIADPQTNRWGAVLPWESAEAATEPGCRADRLPADAVTRLRRRGHCRGTVRGRTSRLPRAGLRGRRTRCPGNPVRPCQ